MFNIKRKITRSLVTALAVVLPMASLPPATADASVLGALIGAGVQMAQYKSALDKANNTEEGRQALFQAMKENQGVNDDPVLNARLDSLMANLSDAIAKIDPSIQKKPYNYFINPDTSFNAACSLGHNMTVNTGIFYMLNTDDEIAVVLGHEMGHGQKDHVVKGFEKSVPVTLIATAISAGGGTAGTIGANVLANYTTKVHVTKPMEWDADNLSFDYLTQTNYNLGACAAVWQKVIETSEKNGDKLTGDIFSVSDHPSHKERRDSYAKKLYEYSNKKVTVADGLVKVNGKDFVTPVASASMSGAERAYFVAGNLARAYHSAEDLPAATVANGTVYIGEQAIMTSIAGDVPAAELAETLNSIK